MIGGILLACMVQGLVLAAALLATARISLSNAYLALTLVVLAGMTSVFVLGWTGRDEVPAWLAFLPVNVSLALGPALFGYVTCLVRGSGPDPRHLFPAVLQLSYLIVMQALPSATQDAWKAGAHDEVIKPLLELATVGSLIAYTALGLRLLQQYRSWLAAQRSDADRYAALWIGRMMVALAATATGLALLRAYTTFVGELDAAPLQLWLAALGAWLGVEGWRQSDRFYPVMQDTAPDTSTDSSGPDWAALGSRWRDAVQAGAWWREPDLTLADTARRLGTNTTYLSRAINEGLGLNFNELINRMRAEEVARRIDAGDAPNFLQMALDAGFSSKATFNRAFRAMHGVSPTDYRSRLKSHKSAVSVDSETPESATSGT